MCFRYHRRQNHFHKSTDRLTVCSPSSYRQTSHWPLDRLRLAKIPLRRPTLVTVNLCLPDSSSSFLSWSVTEALFGPLPPKLRIETLAKFFSLPLRAWFAYSCSHFCQPPTIDLTKLYQLSSSMNLPVLT